VSILRYIIVLNKSTTHKIRSYIYIWRSLELLRSISGCSYTRVGLSEMGNIVLLSLKTRIIACLLCASQAKDAPSQAEVYQNKTFGRRESKTTLNKVSSDTLKILQFQERKLVQFKLLYNHKI